MIQAFSTYWRAYDTDSDALAVLTLMGCPGSCDQRVSTHGECVARAVMALRVLRKRQASPVAPPAENAPLFCVQCGTRLSHPDEWHTDHA